MKAAPPLVLAGILLVIGGLASAFDRDAPRGSGEETSTEAVPLHEHDGAGAHAHPRDDHSHDERSGEGALEPFRPRPVRWRAAEDGSTPAAADASELPHQFRSFRVTGDEGLAEMAEQGYLAGSGSPEDPYVIDGFRVAGTLAIQDTTAPLVVRNSLVEGQLRLNYVGGLLYVHHNRVHDLRVNENVQRREENAGGIFEHNAIEVIGQLRHFGGEFARNEIGPRPSGLVVRFLGDSGPQAAEESLVWNFDGYHLAWVHNNTVHGFTDVKLHGHYHGSCTDCHAHNHAVEDETAELGHEMNHTIRHHALDFENNRIDVREGRALRFNDRAHAGDDRTANSEPNEELERAHEHHTYLRVAGNTLRGGPLVLDIVNAADELHEGRAQEARVDLLRNRVEMELPRAGPLRTAPLVAAYQLLRGAGVEVVARGNAFTFTAGPEESPTMGLLMDAPADAAGFYVERSVGHAFIDGTVGRGAAYGVVLETAEQMRVELGRNRFNAEEEMHRA